MAFTHGTQVDVCMGYIYTHGRVDNSNNNSDTTTTTNNTIDSAPDPIIIRVLVNIVLFCDHVACLKFKLLVVAFVSFVYRLLFGSYNV